MKFLISIFSLIFVLSAASVSAQKIYTMTGSGDTVVNSATEYVSLPLKDGYDCAVYKVEIVKNTGTVTGTAILQQSVDATDYETATGTDTLTFTNVTTAFKHWELDKPKYPYYRIKVTGSGTMAAKVYGYVHVKNISKAMVNRL